MLTQYVMMKKKLDAANFQLKDIFFRVCKRIQNNGEYIRILETSISNATDMSISNATDISQILLWLVVHYFLMALILIVD